MAASASQCVQNIDLQVEVAAEGNLFRRSRLWTDGFHPFYRLSQVNGVHLSAPREVQHFILQAEKLKRNPFENQTLIFIPHQNLDQAALYSFYGQFGHLVSKWGNYIKRLVYQFSRNDGHEAFIEQIQNILKLQQLECLAVKARICGNAPFQIINWARNMGDSEVPQNLKELLLFPNSSKMMCPLLDIFSQFRPLMNSITHLEYSGSSDFDPDRKSLLLCPKLEAIKISNPLPWMVQFYCKSRLEQAAHLKEISFNFGDDLMRSLNGRILKFLLIQLKNHAGFLEHFHFMLNFTKNLCLIFELSRGNATERQNLKFSAKYSNQKEFIVPLESGYFEPRVIWDILESKFIRLEAATREVTDVFAPKVWLAEYLPDMAESVSRIVVRD